MRLPLTAITVASAAAALTLSATAQASTSRPQAVKLAQTYMNLNCADGFDWACINAQYLSPVCRDSTGHTAFFCAGAVREGTPNRITIVIVRVRKRDGDILVRLQPGPRLGQDVVR